MSTDSFLSATNRADMIDPALLRPGRFDKIVFVLMPDKAARQKILEIHSKDKPIGPDVELTRVAELTENLPVAQIQVNAPVTPLQV